MKAQLNFNLEDEEDKRKFQEIANDDITKLKCAMHKFAEQVLRQYRKYTLPVGEIAKSNYCAELTDGEIRMIQLTVEHLETKFYECLDEYEAKVE